MATLRCATIADRLWTVECLVAEFGIMEGGSLSWSEEVDSTEYSPTTLYESGSFASTGTVKVAHLLQTGLPHTVVYYISAGLKESG